MPVRLAPIWLGVAALLGACDETVCPRGVQRLGERCELRAALADATVSGDAESERRPDAATDRFDAALTDGSTHAPDTGSHTQSDAGDAATSDASPGRPEAGTDAGSKDAGSPFVDPCGTPVGERPVECLSPPAAPSLDGETSAGHLDLHWIWTKPEATSSFQVRLDAGPVVELEGDTTRWDQSFPSGTHTLEVRACNEAGCSSYVALATSIERFASMPAPWLGVQKADFARSPLGHHAPLACRDCFSGTGGSVLDTDEALAKIARALSRKADVIELDVARIEGVLHVSRDDPGTPADRPSLQAILQDPGFASANALLSLEIVEVDTPAAELADELLRLLDASRSVVRNGRPLIVKVLDGKLAYLNALKSRASSYPFIAPYLRYWVDYANRGDVAAWQSEIEAEVVSRGFDGVSLAHQSQNLFGVIAYALSRGLGVGLFDVPGPGFGEVVIAGMREDVDLLSSSYRVDQARTLVEAPTGAGYLNARPLTGVGDPLFLRRNTTGTLITETRMLGKAESAETYGQPFWTAFSIGQDLVGGALSFARERRALVLSEIDANPGQGVLVTAVVNLPEPAELAEGESQNIVASTQNAGFAVSLVNPADAPAALRFTVRVGDSYYAHDYPVTGGNPLACSAGASSVFTAALNGSDSYLLTAHYDGTRAPFLFINHQCAGAAPPAASGGIVASEASTLLGADPQPGSVPDARNHFRGYVQQAQLQLWGPHTAQESN